MVVPGGPNHTEPSKNDSATANLPKTKCRTTDESEVLTSSPPIGKSCSSVVTTNE